MSYLGRWRKGGGLMRGTAFKSLLGLLFGYSGSTSWGSVAPAYAPAFPKPHYTANQVAFWEVVFEKYPSTVEVIHDVDYPAVVIDVIDFVAFAKTYKKGVAYTRKERRDLIKRYMARYDEAIKRVQKERKGALRHGAMEKRIFNVYSKHSAALKALYAGQAQLRSQQGLKDEFAQAAVRAQKYLPHMEQMFRQSQLPMDLTRITFVESMFNTEALSKVGASGIWQFMPKTGRDFMTVNGWLDERNSPLKATVAASKLLRSNYKLLGSWPLAITAYNHGAGGMLRAVKATGTKDIGVIAENYRSNTFGFASRNFYAEFLAARNVYNRNYRGSIRPHLAADLRSITLKKPVSIKELLNHTPLTKDILERYNACITDSGYRRYLSRPLPLGYELFVPADIFNKAHKMFDNWAYAGGSFLGSTKSRRL